MPQRVTLELDHHVAIVTLNRADKRNALDVDMFDALIETGDTLKRDKSVRAVILRGAGDHFCAGIDISVFKGAGGIGATGADRMQPRKGSTANFFQSAALVWREIPVPVIAVLRGTVFGGGLQVAMGADLRYASPDTEMSVMEIKWGLIPDMGITTTLRHVVPQDRVRELCYTGCIVNAVEAAGIGLVTAVTDDPEEKAWSVANSIAEKSPDAIRAAKTLIDESWHDEPARALRREADLQSAVMAGDNQQEAVRANLEKRPPAFRDPR